MRTDYHTLLNSKGEPKELDFGQYTNFWEQSSFNYNPPLRYKWHFSSITNQYMWLPEDKENW